MEECIFCRIVAGEVPARVVREDARTVAFLDISPANRGHLLVIPRAHAVDLVSITPEDLAACAHAAQDLARRLLDRLGADGVNLVNSTRAAAWQSVFHFHVHVIPRYVGDGLQAPWRDVGLDPRDADELVGLLR